MTFLINACLWVNADSFYAIRNSTWLRTKLHSLDTIEAAEPPPDVTPIEVPRVMTATELAYAHGQSIARRARRDALEWAHSIVTAHSKAHAAYLLGCALDGVQ